jgi:uncharacterized protein (DUF2141 family)
MLADLLGKPPVRSVTLSFPLKSAATAFLLFALGLGPAVPAGAQDGATCGGPPSATHLNVNVEKVGSTRGLIAVTLYPDVPRKFLAKGGALYVVRVPARMPATRVCVNVPGPGVYALAVYHDANSNRRFDRTGLGLPAEDFGFSNNPRPFFGMPNFSGVRVRVIRSGSWTTIRLN